MNENLSPQFPPHAEMTSLPAKQPKLWGILSIILTVGGALLIGAGGWIYFQQVLEAGKPPPARILELSVADLEQTLTPQPTAAPVKSTPTAVPQTIIETQAQDTFIPTDTPAPEDAEPKETATPRPSTATAEPVEIPTANPEQSEPASAKITQPASKNVLSLADNPLLVVADNPASAAEENAAAPETNAPAGLRLTRIQAESIGMDTGVIDVGWTVVEQNGVQVNVWTVADYAAGWHTNSALPNQGGNVVLSGHHNIKGEVFRYIVNLEPGDVVTLYDENEHPYSYSIEDKFIVKDKGEPDAVRRANARWIGPFNDERLTLVTCWPYNNNTHRVIVIGKPVG